MENFTTNLTEEQTEVLKTNILDVISGRTKHTFFVDLYGQSTCGKSSYLLNLFQDHGFDGYWKETDDGVETLLQDVDYFAEKSFIVLHHIEWAPSEKVIDFLEKLQKKNLVVIIEHNLDEKLPERVLNFINTTVEIKNEQKKNIVKNESEEDDEDKVEDISIMDSINELYQGEKYSLDDYDINFDSKLLENVIVEALSKKNAPLLISLKGKCKSSFTRALLRKVHENYETKIFLRTKQTSLEKFIEIVRKVKGNPEQQPDIFYFENFRYTIMLSKFTEGNFDPEEYNGISDGLSKNEIKLFTENLPNAVYFIDGEKYPRWLLNLCAFHIEVKGLTEQTAKKWITQNVSSLVEESEVNKLYLHFKKNLPMSKEKFNVLANNYLMRKKFQVSEGETNFSAFSLEALNTSLAPQEILKKCEMASNLDGIKLLFHGASGCGKSEFSRYVAKFLGKDFIQIRPSNLISEKVGLTECRIAAVFNEAEAMDKVLIIDEAESFLLDRSVIEKTWEFCQINEFLIAIEEFSGVLILNTNNARLLESALNRRIHLCVEFYPMNEAGLDIALKKYFPNHHFSDEMIKDLTNRHFSVGDIKACYDVMNLSLQQPTVMNIYNHLLERNKVKGNDDVSKFIL